MQDRLVGSSAVFSNGNVVDERILGRFGSRSWEIRGTSCKTGPTLFGFGN